MNDNDSSSGWGPSAKQVRVLWFSLTALAIGIVLALLGLLGWGVGWILKQLSSVLLPLAVAGIIAYLLDPVVDYLERRRVPRQWGILIVFFLAVLIVAGMLATVVPRLVLETRDLVSELPELSRKLTGQVKVWIENQKDSIWVGRLKDAWNNDLQTRLQAWATNAFPVVSAWLFAQAGKVASWAGLIVGLALVPVYTFYFLLEKQGISRSWTDYLPVHESRIKEEIVFIISAINDYLILFFRGQVLVAMCDGILLTIGFLIIGLDYAVLLGVVAGVLSIVPFLGVVLSLVPAVILAIVQFGGWLHPLLVLAIFGIVQFLEGFVISPKIMGDRVGLHPLTIIIAVMVGTTLMGGIIGGILAIPLTAALRVLMFRYVWRRRAEPQIAPRRRVRLQVKP